MTTSAPVAASPSLDPAGRGVGGVGSVLAAWVVARILVGISFGLASLWQRVISSGSTGDGVLRLEQGLLAWDGDWYRKIADGGYEGTEAEALRFFPLYPQLGRLVAAPAGGDVRIGLILLANVGALLALWVLWKLVVFETGDKTLAQRAVWLTALFPSAFVFVWGYSESLFLVACLGCFWGLRARRWAMAAVAGVLASLCRPLGILLFLPAAIEVGRWWWSTRLDARTTGPNGGGLDGASGEHVATEGVAAERVASEETAGAPKASPPSMVRRLGPAKLASAIAAVVAPGLGLVGFGVWLAVTGRGGWDDPFRQQEQFRGDFVDPVTRLVRGARDLLGPEAFGDGLHLPFAVAFIAMAVVCGRRWPASYTAFAAAVLVVSLAADNLNSLERYALSAFPLVLALATLTAKPERQLVAVALSALGLVGLTTLAWIGVYVP